MSRGDAVYYSHETATTDNNDDHDDSDDNSDVCVCVCVYAPCGGIVLLNVNPRDHSHCPTRNINEGKIDLSQVLPFNLHCSIHKETQTYKAKKIFHLKLESTYAMQWYLNTISDTIL